MVVGGGNVAARKVKGVLSKQGQVKLISPLVNDDIAKLAEQNKIVWFKREYRKGDLAGGILIFAATSNRNVQDAVQQEAEDLNILINRADAPEKSTFHVPASFQRGSLQIAVFTDGKSPAMAAKVKKELEDEIGFEYGLLLELISAVRGRIIADSNNSPYKAEMFQKLFHNDMPSWIQQGKWDLVEDHFSSLLGPCNEIDWRAYRRKHP